MEVVKFTYQNNFDIRLVLNGAIFVWLLKNDRIWQLPSPCSPSQLLEFLQAREPEWRNWLEMAGFTELEIRNLTPAAPGAKARYNS